MTKDLNSMDYLLDDARVMYERLRQARWNGSSKEEAIMEAALQEEYIRLTTATGEEVSVCGCGNVYFQQVGCPCGDWIRNWEDAHAHTMMELGLPYRPKYEKSGKVVHINEWHASNSNGWV